MTLSYSSSCSDHHSEIPSGERTSPYLQRLVFESFFKKFHYFPIYPKWISFDVSDRKNNDGSETQKLFQVDTAREEILEDFPFK